MVEEKIILDSGELEVNLSVIMTELSERDRRLVAGCIANSVADTTRKDAVLALHEVCGLSKNTIRRGMKELCDAREDMILGDQEAIDSFIYNTDSKAPQQTDKQDEIVNKVTCKTFPNLKPPKKKGRKRTHVQVPKKRVRKQGAGRPSFISLHPTLPNDIAAVVDLYYGGDPESDRLWCTLSTKNIQKILLEIKEDDGTKRYTSVSRSVIGKTLVKLGFSLQRNKKFVPIVENHKDREPQFENINRVRAAFASCSLKMKNASKVSGDFGDILRISPSDEKLVAGLDEYNTIEDPSKIEIVKLRKNAGYSVLGKTFRYKKEAKKELKKYRDACKAKKTKSLCETVSELIRDGKAFPVSMDAKNGEKIGNFAAHGAEWRQIGNPRLVFDHDYEIKWENDESGKIIPYAVYDIMLNKGYVALGRNYDTAQFACNTFRKYLTEVAPIDHPGFKAVVVFCDGGGSNASRSRLWKYELLKIAKELKITIIVMHYPPGTSKYNLIEHRLFSFISRNWRGRPLITVGIAMNMIKATRTETGLTVQCYVDDTKYVTGLKISDKQMRKIEEFIYPFSDCKQWNYIINGTEATDVDLAAIGPPTLTEVQDTKKPGKPGEKKKAEKEKETSTEAEKEPTSENAA